MPDKETVITHLQIIHTWAEFARERDLQFFTAKHLEDIAQWADDAITLLKEQEELLRKLQKDKDKLCLDVSEWKHKYHDRQLKEQEPVEPKINEYGEAYCICGENVGIIPCSKSLPSIRSKYCSECGRRMK